MLITSAKQSDLEGILALHRTYHTAYIRDEDRPQGFVTTDFTRQQLEALIGKEQGVTLAKDDSGQALAYAMAASWQFWSQWPFFEYMIQRLPDYTFQGEKLTVEGSYQYGPICIHRSVRGSGLFEKVFYASLASMRRRYPTMVTFVNQINPRSYAAHTRKVPMTTAGTFHFNNNDYYLLACPTDLTPEGRETK